ncbi:hypothetical protein PG984_001005 [Apiospora sp. TS-2023a]
MNLGKSSTYSAEHDRHFQQTDTRHTHTTKKAAAATPADAAAPAAPGAPAVMASLSEPRPRPPPGRLRPTVRREALPPSPPPGGLRTNLREREIYVDGLGS